MTVFNIGLFFFFGSIFSVPVIRSSYNQKLIKGLGSVPTVFTNPSVLSTQDSIGYFYDPTTGALIQTRRQAPGSKPINSSNDQNVHSSSLQKTSSSSSQKIGSTALQNGNLSSINLLNPTTSSQSSNTSNLSILKNIPEEALEKLQSEFPHFSRIDIANILSNDPQVVKALQEFSTNYQKTSSSSASTKEQTTTSFSSASTKEQTATSEKKKSDSSNSNRGNYFYPDLSSLS